MWIVMLVEGSKKPREYRHRNRDYAMQRANALVTVLSDAELEVFENEKFVRVSSPA